MIRPALLRGYFGTSYTCFVCGLQYHLGGELDTAGLATLANVKSNDHVLDICCFIGGPALQLTDAFHCRVCGIDIARASKPSWKQRIQHLKTEVHTLYLASKDPRSPWYAKVLTALIIGYAICPIDLVPDFIPVLGQLDDLIIVPAGIALAAKMIPKNLMDECRQKARNEPINTRTKWIVALAIISIWGFATNLVIRSILPLLL